MNIYGIFSKHHNKIVYVGQTIFTNDKRWKEHLDFAFKGKCNFILYNAMRKYGKDNFEFHILDSASQSIAELNLLEIEFILKYKTFHTKDSVGCYNLTTGGSQCEFSELTRKRMSECKKGIPPWNKGKTGIFSEEVRKRISIANTGRKHSEETRKKFSLSLKGKKHSEEHRRKHSESLKGKPLSEDHKKKLSLINKNKILSIEQRLKISQSNKGKHSKKVHTLESKKKISDAIKGKNHPNYGKHHSEETNQKNRLSNLGKKHTPEFKLKISKVTSGKNNPMYGKHHSEESKQKTKLTKAKRNLVRILNVLLIKKMRGD